MENNNRIVQEFIYNFADCIVDYRYTLAENILYIADRITRRTLNQEVLKLTQNYKRKLIEESDDVEELFINI